MTDYLADDIRLILGYNVLAQRHAQEWQTHQMPYTRDERGGSSSPREVSERLEDRAVARQAARDADALRRLLPEFRTELALCGILGEVTPELRRVSERLAQIVARCTRTVDASTLPPDHPTECTSCARSGKIGSRHYQGHTGISVYDKAPKQGLCRYCYDALKATGELPPIDILDTYHRVSPRAAGLEWARRNKQKEQANA